MSGKYLTEEEIGKVLAAIEYAHILYAGKIDKLSAKAIAHMRSKTKNEWKDILDESYYILTAKESETPQTDAADTVRKIRQHTIFHSDDDETEFAFHLTTGQAVALIARIRAESAQEARDELEEWRRIKALFRFEHAHKGRKEGRYVGQYHGHAHDKAGMWDSDNGPLAGKECAVCAAFRAAIAGKEE